MGQVFYQVAVSYSPTRVAGAGALVQSIATVCDNSVKCSSQYQSKGLCMLSPLKSEML